MNIDQGVQGLGLLGLALGIGLCYWRWIQPRSAQISGYVQGALVLFALTLVGGTLGGVGWFIDDSRAFAWDLPPLAARMLAAAGWAFGMACALTLASPTPARIRLLLIGLFVYLAPLAIAIAFFHLDRFDFTQPIAYAFFAIVGFMLIATCVYLLRSPTLAQASPDPPPTTAARRWLLVIAVVTGVWGVALFATDRGPIALIWAWPGDLLTSRLIAVMLLTLAAGSAFARRYQSAAGVMRLMSLVYGLGVVIATTWGLSTGKPVQWGYFGAFAAVMLGSLFFRSAENKTDL